MKYVFLIFLSFIILNGFGQAEEYTNKRMLNSFTDGNNIVALSGIFIVKNNSKGFSLDQERFIKDGVSYTNGITGYINNPDLLWFDFHHTLRGYLFYYTIRPFIEIKYATLVAENGVMLNIGGGGGVSYAGIIDGLGVSFSYNYITPFVNFSDIELPYNIHTIKLSLYYQW